MGDAGAGPSALRSQRDRADKGRHLFSIFPYPRPLFLLEAAMPFRGAAHSGSAERRRFPWLLLVLLWRPALGGAEEPATGSSAAPAVKKSVVDKPAVAKPAAKLAGTLAHVRPEKFRKAKSDLMNQIDTGRDVVYTTQESPIPESEQFQFVDRILRTPKSGDARLCLPVDVPKFYNLTIVFQQHNAEEDPRVGVGLVLDGRQFLMESTRDENAYEQFFGQRIVSLSPRPPIPPPKVGKAPRPSNELVNVLVGDCGFLSYGRGTLVECVGPSRLLSLDPKWAVPATDKLFLTFPDGQVDIVTIQLKSLTREDWFKQVKMLKPQGLIARWEIVTGSPRISVSVDPLPQLESLKATFIRLAYEGDFDELERWARRFREGEMVESFDFVSQGFYDRVGRSYLPRGSSEQPVLSDINWQQQLAFANAWIKKKPDSVAARIVKANTCLNYAWVARGNGYADTVTPEGWRLFHERIAQAEEALQEAARQPAADSCVFSALLTVGMAESWDHEKMELTLERGLQISKKNFSLYDNMTYYLLPRWGGAPGDVGKLAERMLNRVKGDDGLEIYARLALAMRLWREEPVGFSDDTLRSALPVLLKRYPDLGRVKNFVCWSYSKLPDREAAQPLLADVVARPDFFVWGSRTELDQWRHRCDPSIPEPSQFLALEGEEAAHLQAFSAGPVTVQFLSDNQTLVTSSPLVGSGYKIWKWQEQKIIADFNSQQPDWSIQHFRSLSDGALFAIVQEGDKLISAYTHAPAYEITRWPWMVRGTKIIRISDDQLTGANAEDEQVTIVHAREKRIIRFQVPKLAEISLSRDGKHLLSLGEKLQLWDAATGDAAETFDFVPEFFTFMEDHSGFIYLTGDKLAVWDLGKKQERFAASFAEPNLVRIVASTKDGRYLATGELRVDANGTRHEVVVLRDLDKAEPIHVFDGHKQAIQRVAFSPDGRWLASGSSDGVVKVWDVAKVVAPVAGMPDKPEQHSPEDPRAN
jgi:hypothetical protein